MYYELINDLVTLVKQYEEGAGAADVKSFNTWLSLQLGSKTIDAHSEPEWSGKASGRSADSVINTSLVHLYRYAKSHAKTAIIESSFSTPDDFIYLINLVSLGSMTKTALIKLNVHEKSAGMQIVNRLINNGLVEQEAMENDKRNRMIHITANGRQLLNERMHEIRKASSRVTEPLNIQEKMDLIRLFSKLEDFHASKSKTELQTNI
ncbi:MarR family winged helix-turn-helix transcriptional regulator [Pedobacter duraquae]|uniref:DNA-binding MarR family transcriptional regulator n=1 Tax=Pedobacter duraquae TaxID=425511 RepID=A0A4R6IKI3_9SPHI|nr:MarR family winged helix-turn-helix transcriptional regulator [Pedobacter duraquae]TDO22543.1 DNA-binding MarR family transcriptional regulator [Pedobacter duraquae]